MADTKLSALATATDVDFLYGEIGGVSKKIAPINTIQSINVITGAAPVDITLSDYANWGALIVLVTSGGTAGVEVLNFIGPDDGITNTVVGRTINVVFTHQTNPGDVIHITQNSGGTFSCVDNIGNAIGTFAAGIFNQEGNNIVFSFTGDVIQQYQWNCLFGAWDNATVMADSRGPLPPGGVSGQIPFSDGSGGAQWSNGPLKPFPTFNSGSVLNLNNSYPAASYANGTAVVFDADTPVVGSVVVGGGSSRCFVISNGIDYIVMFVFP